jgi:hypothetical protein
VGWCSMRLESAGRGCGCEERVLAARVHTIAPACPREKNKAVPVQFQRDTGQCRSLVARSSRRMGKIFEGYLNFFSRIVQVIYLYTYSYVLRLGTYFSEFFMIAEFV